MTGTLPEYDDPERAVITGNRPCVGDTGESAAGAVQFTVATMARGKLGTFPSPNV